MVLFERIAGLLLRPREEWQRIVAEPVTDPLQPLRAYAAPVSAVPAVAGLIGGLVVDQMVGSMLPGVPRPGLGAHLFAAIASWVLGLLGVFIIAKLVELLAPRFGGSASPVAAMKLAAHAPTAAWVAGIAVIIPPLGFLTLLGLYSLYLFWVGVPLVVQVPPERRLVFTLALIGCGIAVSVLIRALVALIPLIR